jgi:5-methylcytosine-specific restriction endonuclease McrA
MIFERDERVCHLCDRTVEREEASRDHVIPRSLGGRTNAANIKLAHRKCNNTRGSMAVSDFRNRYVV